MPGLRQLIAALKGDVVDEVPSGARNSGACTTYCEVPLTPANFPVPEVNVGVPVMALSWLDFSPENFEANVSPLGSVPTQ